MQVSHSRIDCFVQCPYKFKLRYLDELTTIKDQEASNALYLGVATHIGIEQDAQAGVNNYLNNYYVISDEQINETIKILNLVPKVKELLTDDARFEVELNTPDFKGFIDCLVPDGEHKWKLYDFKYSNHKDKYLLSEQLHLYKYWFEKLNPFETITEMAFIMIPKTFIRQKKTETIGDFRNRLRRTLETMQVEIVPVEYNPNMVIDFLLKTKNCIEATNFTKKETKLCDFCEFKEYCKNGDELMLLPSTERVAVNPASKIKLWVYGAPFSGKTTLADQFPTALMLNTDGNLNSFTSPRIAIKETFEGRQKIAAWENFNNIVDELQKGSEFETIVIDLVEDIYEHCRQACYQELGIEHESDNSFKAYDYVRTKFLTTMKRLMTLDYNIVLISHEDMSKDITKRSGDKVTSIRPNINEKVANKLAGMVDVVARAVANGNDRKLEFKADSVVFGGGRLKLSQNAIPLNYQALLNVYKSQGVTIAKTTTVQEEPVKQDVVENTTSETVVLLEGQEIKGERVVNEPITAEEVEQPVRRTRRVRGN